MFQKKKNVQYDVDMNLTPIIDCFVTLLCFMLLSSTYANLVGMEAKVPLAVPASEMPTPKKDPFHLNLLFKKKGLELSVKGAGRLNGKKVFAIAKEEDLDRALKALHKELVKIKHAKPKEFSIHFESKVALKYADLIRIMDATRNLSQNDGQVLIKDERNGKEVKVDLLFPDFVMAGLN